MKTISNARIRDILCAFSCTAVMLVGLSTRGGEPAEFELSLSEGWNLVSVPIEPDNPSVTAVFGDAVRGPVWAWDGDHYRAAEDISPAVGYWVYGIEGLDAEVGGVRTVTGTLASVTATALTPGWHLVGPVLSDGGTTSLPLPLATVPRDISPSAVWQYGGNGYEARAELDMGAGAWIWLDDHASVLLSQAPRFAGAGLLYSPRPHALTVHWPAAADGDVTYAVYLAPDGTDQLVTESNRRATLEHDRRSYTAEGLDPAQTYACVVVAEDANGNRSRTGRDPLKAMPRAPEAELQTNLVVHDLDADGYEVLDVMETDTGDGVTLILESAFGLSVGEAVLFANPHGQDLLRIISINTTDTGPDELTAEAISLADVLGNAQLNAQFQLPAPTTVKWQTSDSEEAFYIGSDGFLALTQPRGDGGEPTAGGTMPFSGERELAPGVRLAYDLQFAPRIDCRTRWDEQAGLDEFLFSLDGELSSSLRLSVSSTEVIDIQQQTVELGEVRHRYRYSVGELPIIQEIAVQLRAEVSAASQRGASAAVHMSETDTVGMSVEYNQSTWQTTHVNAQRPEVTFDLPAAANLNAEIAVYPVVSFTFYSAEGVELERSSNLQWDMARRFFPPPTEITKLDLTTRTDQRVTVRRAILGLAADDSFADEQRTLEPTPLFTLPEVQFQPSTPAETLVEAPLELEVTVTDGVNNPVDPETIFWIIEDSPGLVPRSALSVSDDRLSAELTPPLVGEYTVRCSVRATGDAGSTGTRSEAVTVRAVNENFRVIDLAGGPDAESYPVTRHLSIDDTQHEIYKTTSLLLRRIAAAETTFTMGSPEGELGAGTDETPHEVSFTNDYFIGVFETTQQQWELVMGEPAGQYPGDTRPAEQLSYDDIRGADVGARWPATRAVGGDSFVGRLRERTNLPFLDLPTEAQWEFACRAGTTTALNSGKNLSVEQNEPKLDPLGRYWYNDGEGQQHAPVGSYQPNTWGLHDMHGNVSEWCLDWYAEYPTASVTNPAGPDTGTNRVLRGGSWLDPAKNCRSAARTSAPNDNRSHERGFRIASLAPGKPRIISFIPAQAPPGTEITINGNEFIGTQSVEFNGVPAPRFIVDSDTRLRATVPDSATTGPITVTTLVGTVASATGFVVAEPIDPPAFMQSAVGWSADSATASTTSEITAVDGDLYLAAVSAKPHTPVVEINGLGLAWTRIRAQCGARSQTGVEVWMAQGTPESDETVQATLESQASSAVIAVSRYTNVRSDSPLGAIVSANTNGIDGDCSGEGEDSDEYSFSIGVQSEASRVFVALGKRRRDLAHGNAYTLRGEATADTGSSGDDSSVAVLDRLAAPFTNVPVNGKLSWISDWAAVAVEIPANSAN